MNINKALLETAVNEATRSFFRNNNTPKSMLTFVATSQRSNVERAYETACQMYLNMSKSPDVSPSPELPAELSVEERALLEEHLRENMNTDRKSAEKGQRQLEQMFRQLTTALFTYAGVSPETARKIVDEIFSGKG